MSQFLIIDKNGRKIRVRDGLGSDGHTYIQPPGEKFATRFVIDPENPECMALSGRYDIRPADLSEAPGKWDLRFLRMALMVATWSKDPSTQVGCVLVDHQRIVRGIGYNGFPRGVDDSSDRLEDRETKYLLVQHAEPNAITNASGRTQGCTAYVTHHPCSQCTGLLIQAGIRRVVTVAPTGGIADRYRASFKAAGTMMKESGIDLTFIDAADTGS